MSHVQHQAMCITSFQTDVLYKCRERINYLRVLLSEIHSDNVNGYSTFFVYPSGSKSGWPEEEEHLASISKIKNIIASYDYEDGSNPIDFHVAIYGDSEG